MPTPGAKSAGRTAIVGGLVVASLVLSLVASRNLEVRADLVSLLPSDSPAAASYRIFLEQFGGLEKVFVLILPEAGVPARDGELAEAASLLEETLARAPTVAGVRAGLSDEDETFFLERVLPRAPILLGDDWKEVVESRIEPSALRRQARLLKEKVLSPGGTVEGRLLASDPLELRRALVSLSAGLAINPLTSTFEGAEGGAALVVVTPARAELDATGGRELQRDLEASYLEVRSAVEDRVRFLAVGGPLYAAHDEAILRGDLERTVSSSVLVAGLLLVVAFGGWRLPLAMIVTIAVGLFWSVGIISALTPGISALSAGFAAVVVGLGLDYAIHVAASFQRCTEAERSTPGGMWKAARGVGPGILVSAVTTAGGFFVLSFATFGPLRDLGFIVPVSLLSILVATGLGFGAMSVATRRVRSATVLWRWLERAVGRSVDFASGRSGWVLLVAFVITCATVVGLRDLSFSSDLSGFRSSRHPLLEAERQLSLHAGMGLDTATLMVQGRDLSEALSRARRATVLLRDTLGEQAEVSAPSDFLSGPQPSAERVAALSRLPLEAAADRLESELSSAGLNPAAFSRGIEALRALGRGVDPGGGTEASWPAWISESVSVGAEVAWVAVSIRLAAGSWPDGPPLALKDELERLAPGSSFASIEAVGADIRSVAFRDFRKLGLFAMVVVLGLVFTSFRGSLRLSLLAVLPVVVGVVWTLGIGSFFGMRLDLFGLASLPILIGIGVDDGLHVVHSSRAERQPIGLSVISVGNAVVLTTLTTAIGFGSLVLSSVPSLRAGGALLATGVLSCLATTVLILPAVEARFGGRG